MASNGKTVLVTGGGGFIGSHVVRRLVKDGHDVCLLLKPTSNCERIADVLSSVRRFDGDMNDVESIRRCMTEVKPQGIFHLAASNIRAGERAADAAVVDTNILGMARLLEASKDLPYEFFIHTGSFLEYGMKTEPMRETDVCAPPELYSISKLAATLLGQAAGTAGGKPVVTFRVFTPYGPGMQAGRLVEQIIRRALAGEEIPLTQPTVTRDFLYVTDLADLLVAGMTKAKECSGRVFNAGGGQSVSLQALVDEVLTQTGSKSVVRWNAFPPVTYDSARCEADMSTTLKQFPWQPAHTLSTGLRDTIEWMRSR